MSCLTQNMGKQEPPERNKYEDDAQTFILAECLKDERKKAGLTQEQLAERIGTKKSYIRLEDMLDLYEWRYLFDNKNANEYKFGYPEYNKANNYTSIGTWHWNFYGPFTITVNPADVRCDIDGDGTKNKVPAGFYVGYDKFGTGLFAPGAIGAAANSVNVTDPTDGAASGHFVKTEFGVLTYHNNGTKLTKNRHLYVPIKVQYGWGEFTVEVTVLIYATDEA